MQYKKICNINKHSNITCIGYSIFKDGWNHLVLLSNTLTADICDISVGETTMLNKTCQGHTNIISCLSDIQWKKVRAGE